MKFLKSFSYAFAGLKLGMGERNMKIHIAATLVIIFLGNLFAITKMEWVAVLLAVGLVIATELLNTAVEEICDLLTHAHPHTYSKAGKPKDIAAGAVLVASIIAACVGTIIFLPYIISFLN